MNKGWMLVGAMAAVVGMGCNRQSVPEAKVEEKTVKKIAEQVDYKTELFPFKVGNEWDYAVEGVRIRGQQRARPNVEVTYRIVAVNGDTATVSVVDRTNKEIDRQVWRANEKGLFQISVSTNNVAFNPPQPIAMFPMEAGKSFTWTGSGIIPTGERGSQSLEGTILAPIVTNSPAGDYEAYPIETKFTITSPSKGTGTSTVFFAPGVGIVRYKQTIRTETEISDITMRLKEARLK